MLMLKQLEIIRSTINMQVLRSLLVAGIGLVSGAPQFGPIGPAHGPFHGHGKARPHHAPIHHDPYGKVPPRPFAYEYGVQDSYSGADFAKKEIQDEYGVVTGEYRVALPDGRIQIVTYRADHEGGYIADVRYEGAAVYPGPPKGGYAPAPLAHRPAHGPHHGPGPLFGRK